MTRVKFCNKVVLLVNYVVYVTSCLGNVNKWRVGVGAESAC
jgi:hypothetical protein